MGIREHLLAGPLGFGAAPLGNMFRNIPDAEAEATVQAAWTAGTRFFDTAPFYGAGLSEVRLGQELAQHNRSEYMLSSKVGRIILGEEEQESQTFGEKGNLFAHGNRKKILYGYTELGTMKSIEDSLKRIGVSHLDFVWIHDVARDFHGDEWIAAFEIAHRGAMIALTKLREQKVIKAWGLGVNRVEPCELTIDMTQVRPDAFLLAGRYTLLDHERALQRLMPRCEAENVDIVIGGPYSSGVLAGGNHFEYAPAPPEILNRVQRIRTLCEKFKISIKAAALHFCLAHPASAAVIPGASKPDRIAEDHVALKTVVPSEFWRELRKQELVSPNAPLPSDDEQGALYAVATEAGNLGNLD
jgi:D-threo-aldose 1-dehydrogenase